MARKKTKEPDPSPERYPHIARWCNQYGRIELGYQWQDELFARAFDEGGQVWGGEGPFATFDDALRALEEGLKEHMEENEFE